MRKAVFLDRDGTINEETGYLDSVENLHVYSYAGPAIRKLNAAAWNVIIATNQSGVARGYFPEARVHAIHEQLKAELAREDAFVDAIYYCPHYAEAEVPEYRQQCDCRKPAPGMLHRAALEWDLDLRSSFIVGDKYSDLEAGFRAGTRGILVLSGCGRDEYARHRQWPRQPDWVAVDLAAAVERILDHSGRDA